MNTTTTPTAEEFEKMTRAQDVVSSNTKAKLIKATVTALGVAGLAMGGIGIAASPVLAWYAAGAILTSFGFTFGWLANLLVAWLIFTPIAGFLASFFVAGLKLLGMR